MDIETSFVHSVSMWSLHEEDKSCGDSQWTKLVLKQL